MNKSNISLIKTCSSCGQQKPLSAFLQVAGAEANSYGNICSACRKTNSEKTPSAKETEEGTTSTTELELNSKTKLKSDIDKGKLRKQTEQAYFEERDKNDAKHIHHLQKADAITQDEKKQRERLLGKRSLFDKKPQVSNPSQISGAEENRANATKLDFTKKVEFGVAGQVKMTSSVFQAFKGWLQGDAPIVGAAERALAAQKKADNNKTPQKSVSKEEYVQRGPGAKK